MEICILFGRLYWPNRHRHRAIAIWVYWIAYRSHNRIRWNVNSSQFIDRNQTYTRDDAEIPYISELVIEAHTKHWMSAVLHEVELEARALSTNTYFLAVRNTKRERKISINCRSFPAPITSEYKLPRAKPNWTKPKWTIERIYMKQCQIFWHRHHNPATNESFIERRQRLKEAEFRWIFRMIWSSLGLVHFERGLSFGYYFSVLKLHLDVFGMWRAQIRTLKIEKPIFRVKSLSTKFLTRSNGPPV